MTRDSAACRTRLLRHICSDSTAAKRSPQGTLLLGGNCVSEYGDSPWPPLFANKVGWEKAPPPA